MTYHYYPTGLGQTISLNAAKTDLIKIDVSRSVITSCGQDWNHWNQYITNNNFLALTRSQLKILVASYFIGSYVHP